MTLQNDVLAAPDCDGANPASQPGQIREYQAIKDENRRLKCQLAEQIAVNARYETAVDVFRTAASHDLISPIQNIYAFARLLQRDLSPEDQRVREYLDFILRGADRMRLLVQSLWDFSRHTPWQVHHEDVALNRTIDQAIAHLSDSIEETGLVIECDDLPSLEGDAAMFELLFCCLMDNAIKFRTQERPHLRIVDSSDDRHVRLTFIDNGIGIDLEFAEAIFEPLKRLHGPMDRMGAGLGLSMCQEIVKSHHGTIVVVQSNERGSSILIELPRIQAPSRIDRQLA